MSFIDTLNNLLRRKPKPVPEPPKPAPAPVPEPGLKTYLKIWERLRKIPITQLFPAVTSVSAVVFFAISGVLAWLVIFCAFVLRLFKIVL